MSEVTNLILHLSTFDTDQLPAVNAPTPPFDPTSKQEGAHR